MLDAQVVAACLASREAYERVAPFLTKSDFTPAGAFWWELVRDWYDSDRTAATVTRSALEQLGATRITNPKHRESLMGFLNELPTPDSPANIASVLLELKRHNVGLELATAIASQDQKKVRVLLPQFDALMACTELRKDTPTQIAYAVSVEELFRKVDSANRVPLAPALLNERIGGGALPGHHILIFGRPEAGKSTFAINMAGSLVRRGKRVLYIGNEDQIDILKSRMLSRVTGLTWEEAERRPDEAAKLFRQRNGEDCLRMAQARHATANDLRKPIEEFEPEILVLDQIRNLHSDDENMTQSLNKIAIQVRGLLLDYGLIGVSVTQANDRTERHGQQPPAWLGMADVDSSRTGLPAQADLMLGIGCDSDLQARNQRAISLPKNKLSSAPNSHSGFIVTLDTARSKVT